MSKPVRRPNHRFNPLHWCRTARTVIQDMRAKEPRQETLGRFLHDQDGAVAAIVAVSLVVILGFAGLAIDMSYAYSTRNMLQITASAAALAAAPELPDQSQARAKALEYVEKNMPFANHGKVLDNSDVKFGYWNPDAETFSRGVTPYNAVEVITKRAEVNGNELDLALAPILGLGFLNIETSAVAYSKAPTAWDVALVQDVTSSFTMEIDDARTADQALLDCVSNNFINSKMGLTAFTGTSHIMTPMLPVGLPANGTNYVLMSDAITNLNSCKGSPSDPPMPPCSGTHVGIGIESAIEQLGSYVPPPGIIGQAIVIVSDGKPQAVPWGQEFYSESDYYYVCGGDCSSNELAEMANLAANEAASKGYDVYAVFYDEDNDDVAAEFFEGLVRGTGQFKRTPNSDELEELMFDLCRNFMDLQLVL